MPSYEWYELYGPDRITSVSVETAADFTSDNPVLINHQLGVESDTGKMKVGDGATAYADLAYLPGGGGGGITIPTDTGGLVAGMVGLEYNGAGYAIGGATKTISFDTYYLDPATTDSSAFTVGDAPVETDTLTFDLTSGTTVQVKADGLYAVYVSLFLSAALTHAAYVQIHGQLGANGRVWLPIGANSYDFNVAITLRADDTIFFSLGGVNAADQTTNVSYAALAAARVG